jgi:hypothetical protein
LTPRRIRRLRAHRTIREAVVGLLIASAFIISLWVIQ